MLLSIDLLISISFSSVFRSFGLESSWFFFLRSKRSFWISLNSSLSCSCSWFFLNSEKLLFKVLSDNLSCFIAKSFNSLDISLAIFSISIFLKCSIVLSNSFIMLSWEKSISSNLSSTFSLFISWASSKSSSRSFFISSDISSSIILLICSCFLRISSDLSFWSLFSSFANLFLSSSKSFWSFFWSLRKFSSEDLSSQLRAFLLIKEDFISLSWELRLCIFFCKELNDLFWDSLFALASSLICFLEGSRKNIFFEILFLGPFTPSLSLTTK